MQPKKSSKTPIIILVAILVVGALVYFFMSGTPVDEESLYVTDVENPQASLIGAQVLSLLNQVSTLQIDASLFKTDAYKSLVDHTVPIYEQNVGKQNPFIDPRPRPVQTPAR